jgi:hypothetical protein
MQEWIGSSLGQVPFENQCGSRSKMAARWTSWILYSGLMGRWISLCTGWHPFDQLPPQFTGMHSIALSSIWKNLCDNEATFFYWIMQILPTMIFGKRNKLKISVYPPNKFLNQLLSVCQVFMLSYKCNLVIISCNIAIKHSQTSIFKVFSLVFIKLASRITSL